MLPEAGDEGSITRPVLKEYLSHLASAGLADQTRLGYLVTLRIFLDHCRRQQLLSGLPAEAQLYPEDMPSHGEYLPRFVSEPVMAKLESAENLARIADDTRVGSSPSSSRPVLGQATCNFAIDAVVDDSVGWPCLRFFNSKVRTEQVVPLSPKAATALHEQAEAVRRDWPQAPGSSSRGSGPIPMARSRSPMRRSRVPAAALAS